MTSVLVALGDPGSSRLVYAMVVGLVAVGIAFVLLGAWLVRQTRRDLEVLAPLERMGESDWFKSDPASQSRMLDAVRPAGATPLRASLSAPVLDARFDSAQPIASFSDLGPGLEHETRASPATDAGGAGREQVDPTPMWIDPGVTDLPAVDDTQSGLEAAREASSEP